MYENKNDEPYKYFNTIHMFINNSNLLIDENYYN